MAPHSNAPTVPTLAYDRPGVRVEVQPASPAASLVSQNGNVASNVTEKVRGLYIVTRSHATLNGTRKRATSSGGRKQEISLTPYAPHVSTRYGQRCQRPVVGWYMEIHVQLGGHTLCS